MAAVGIDVGKANLDVAVFGEAKVLRVANTATGIRRLLQRLRGLGEVRIVLEATGGYEDAVLAACSEAGLWIARVNPRQARDFARATGQLAKTDDLDARMLAEMGTCCGSTPRRRCGRPKGWGRCSRRACCRCCPSWVS